MLERLVHATNGAVGVGLVLAALVALAMAEAGRLGPVGSWGRWAARATGPLSAVVAGVVIARLAVLA